MTRDDILATASRLVTGERRDAHGEAEDAFAAIAALWNAYVDHCGPGGLDAVDVAIMLALFKVGRMTQNRLHEDNYVDLAGYAALAGELAVTVKS